MLFRRRQAVWVLLATLIAMLVTASQNYALSNGMEIMGDAFSLGFTAAIFLISLALFLYARALHKQNVFKQPDSFAPQRSNVYTTKKRLTVEALSR